MRGNSSHGNREIPASPVADGATGRSEKVYDRTADVNDAGKSEDRVVPEKPPNNGRTPAEAVEGRRSVEGNTASEAASRTQSRGLASTELERVREVVLHSYSQDRFYAKHPR